jgi:hypothetical protein
MIAFWFTVLAASTSVIVADPLNSPPVAGEEHAQFFQSLNLLDKATLALPPLPASDAPPPPAAGNAVVPGAGIAGPIGDAWVWNQGEPEWTIPVQGPPPVHEEPPVSGWSRVLAQGAPIALTAVALMALSLLMSLVPRR